MFRKRRKTSDFDAEIEAHLQLEADRLQAEGMGEPEARMAARQTLLAVVALVLLIKSKIRLPSHARETPSPAPAALATCQAQR